MIQVHQGDSKTIKLVFTDTSGNPLNISGTTIYYSAARTWDNVNDTPIIYKVITGHAIPESGISYMYFNTGDTNHCPADYVAGFKIRDTGENIMTFAMDGLRILPAPLI